MKFSKLPIEFLSFHLSRDSIVHRTWFTINGGEFRNSFSSMLNQKCNNIQCFHAKKVQRLEYVFEFLQYWLECGKHLQHKSKTYLVMALEKQKPISEVHWLSQTISLSPILNMPSICSTVSDSFRGRIRASFGLFWALSAECDCKDSLCRILILNK